MAYGWLRGRLLQCSVRISLFLWNPALTASLGQPLRRGCKQPGCWSRRSRQAAADCSQLVWVRSAQSRANLICIADTACLASEITPATISSAQRVPLLELSRQPVLQSQAAAPYPKSSVTGMCSECQTAIYNSRLRLRPTTRSGSLLRPEQSMTNW